MALDDEQEKELKEKLGQFRDNNIALKKTVEGFEALNTTIEALGGADGLKKIQEEQAAEGRKELVKAGDVEAALVAQEGRLKTDFDKRIDAMNTEKEGTAKALHSLQVRDPLKTEAIRAGASEDLLDDLLNSISGEWELEKGELVRKVNGEAQLSTENAGKNQTPGEFFGEFAQSKPSYFNGSGGAGGQEQGAGKGKPVIPRTAKAMGENAEAIRKGEVVVAKGNY